MKWEEEKKKIKCAEEGRIRNEKELKIKKCVI